MNTQRANGSGPLPAPIVQMLERLIRRVRWTILLKGLCATGAVAIGGFLLVMAIDAGITLFTAWPRWVLALAAYAAAIASAFWFLVRPFARTFTLTGAARLLEAHHPEMQERISSAVELLTSRDMPSLRGSEALIAALADEAAVDAAAVQPKREVSLRAAVPFFIAAGVVLAVLAGLMLGLPRQTRFLLARAAAPFLNLPNVFAADLAVDPGDVSVAEGTRLSIAVTASNRVVTWARLRKVGRDGRETAEDMVAVPVTNGPGKRFVATLPNVECGFRYRIHSGDALTRYYTVTVTIPPVIHHTDIQCEYPEYAGLAPSRERDGPGTIRALVGSRITVSVQVNKAVPSAVLRTTMPGATNEIPGALRQASDGLYFDFPFEMPAQVAGLWTIRLTDEIGLRNAPFEHTIQAIPDRPPLVRLPQMAAKEIRLGREDRLPVMYTAEDDLGLDHVSLRLSINGVNEPDRPLPFPTNAPSTVKAVQGSAMINLADPIFTNAHRVEFSVAAADKLPPTFHGPQEGVSPTCVIVLDANAASWEQQVALSQEQRLRQGLQQVQKELTAAKAEAEAVREPVQKEKDLSAPTTKVLGQLQDRLETAALTLHDLSAALSNGYYVGIATNLGRVAEENVARAGALASEIKLADQPEQRGRMASEVTNEVARSLAAVNDALKQLDASALALRHAMELNQLAEKQTELAAAKAAMEAPPPEARTPAELAPPVRMPPAEWKKEEEKVAAEVAQISRETPGTAQALMKVDRETATHTAEEARDLAKEQAAVADLVQKQAGVGQNVEQALRELAGQQEQLAAEARTDPLTRTPAAPMVLAAERIKSDQLDQAVRAQTEAEAGLKAAAENLRQTLPVEKADERKDQPSPKEQAAEAIRLADRASAQAQKAAEIAGDQTQRAQQRSEKAELLAKEAAQSGNAELGREMAAEAVQVKQDVQEVAQWKQGARQAADAARVAAGEVRQAADRVDKAPTPDAARQAADGAAQAAERAAEEGRRAGEFAEQAAQAATEPGAPQNRAVQAADQAREAVAQAEQAEHRADRAADDARLKTEQAAAKVEQARQAAKEDQIKEAQAQADQAKERGAEADRAALGAQRAVTEAHQAADRADEAARQAAAEKANTPAGGDARRAEDAAKDAAMAAAVASQFAWAAEAAARPPAAPKQQASEYAQRAEQAAREADQAAGQAQQTAQQLARAADQAQHLSDAAQKEKGAKADLVHAVAEDAGQAKQASQQAQTAADGAKQAAQTAKEASQAARQAAERITPQTPAAEAEPLAKQAREAAQTAAVKAEDAKELAEAAAARQASPAAERQAYAQQAQAASQQSAQLAAEARQSVQDAQQAVQQAQQVAQQAQQLAQQPQPKGKEDVTRDRTDRAAQAQKAAEAVRQEANEAQAASQQAQAAAQQAQQFAQLAGGAPTRQVAEQAMLDARHAAERTGEAARKADLAAVEARRDAGVQLTKQEANKVEDIARRQGDLVRRAAEIQDQKTQSLEAQKGELLKRAEAEQVALAGDAEKLAGDMAAARPEEKKEAAHAAESVREAAKELAQGDLPQADKAADQAAQEFGRLAGELRASALRAPAAPAEERQAMADLAERSDALVERQKALDRQFEAIAANRPIEPLEERAGALAGRIADLAEHAEAMKNHARDLGINAPASQQAAQAAEQLTHAHQEADLAAERLNQAGKAKSAAPPTLSAQTAQGVQQAEQSTIQSLQQAAQTLDGLAKALAQTEPAQAGNPELPEAYQQAREAALTQKADDAIQASESIAQAARQASEQARALGANPEPAHAQAMMVTSGMGINPMESVDEEVPQWARKIGLKLKDWLRLPGELRDEVLQGSAAEGPEEYRPIIKRYFREVARRGGENENAK